MVMYGLELRLLGEGTVLVEGEQVRSLPRKELHTLAYLALHSPRAPIGRDALATMLWPENTEAQARFYLRKVLNHIRQALGSQAARLQSPTPRTLRLDLSHNAFCDALAFDTASSQEKLALYKGPLLPECYDDWVLPEREKRQKAYEQALASATTESAPSLKRPRTLPAPLTELIGRTEILKELCGALSRYRLLTLLGPGGAGKTRLAIAAAQAAQSQFSDGVHFVDFSAKAEGTGLAQAILTALSLPGGRGQSADEALLAALSEKDALFVLDNCEHVVDEAAVLTLTLLTHCPGLKVLITSRQALGLAGEQVFPVPALDLPPTVGNAAEKNPTALLDYSAIRLFVERATQANRAFRLEQENSDAVVALCYRLDGMPLALEMAASRLRSHSLESVATALSERLDILAAANRAVPPRQQSLRAAIEWSYDALSPSEQTLFRAVSVFAGGWSTEAAEAVCPGASSLLPGLVEKSLVVFTSAPTGSRYQQLQTLQQFAAEQREKQGETHECRVRHLGYFLSLCRESQPCQDGPKTTEELEKVEREHDNIRAALSFGLADLDSGIRQKAFLLASYLNRFWLHQGYLQEGWKWCEAALAIGIPQDVADTALQDAWARCTLGAGALALLAGDVTTAQAHAKRGLCHARQRGSAYFTGLALATLANSAQSQGDIPLAYEYRRECLTYARESSDGPLLARALSNLGMAGGNEDTERLRLQEEALAVARACGDRRMVAHILGVLAHIYQEQGRHIIARPYALESLELSRAINNKHGLCVSLNYVADGYEHEGDWAQARRYRCESLRIAAEIGWQEHCSSLLGNLAAIESHEGRYLVAAQLWGAQHQHRRRLQLFAMDPNQEALLTTTRVALGEAAFSQAFAQGAALSLSAAIALATE